MINSIDQPRPTLQSYKVSHGRREKEAPQYQAFMFDTADWTHRHIDTYAFKDQTFSIHRRPIDKSEYDNSDRIPSVWLGDNDYFLLTRTSRDLKRIDMMPCRHRRRLAQGTRLGRGAAQQIARDTHASVAQIG